LPEIIIKGVSDRRDGGDTHTPHFIHDRVGVILRERHHRALALFLAIRRDARVRSDLLPKGPKGHGILLDAREELWFGSVVIVRDELLKRAPNVVDGRG
jgi:hypothetical protein